MIDRALQKKKINRYWKMIEKRERENLEHMPNQKWHQIVSFIKSGFRLAGYGLLLYSVPIAVGVLIFSEIIGIIEELV